MKKVKTQWEVRRQKYHDSTRYVETFASEVEARVRAMQLAIKKEDCYRDEVKLVEVETHEEQLEAYSAAYATRQLTPARVEAC